jgi:hypothetical protein
MERVVSYVEEPTAKWLIEEATRERRSVSALIAIFIEEARALRNGGQGEHNQQD